MFFSDIMSEGDRDMKKNTYQMLAIMIGCLLLLGLAGCGSKSPENVIGKLESKLNGMEGYKVIAEMNMKTGEEERNYEVAVWYQKGQEDFYRVALHSGKEDDGQVILKNEEGVFVLTPALKKSFKFQNDWPESSSQPYLYQSLIKDVITDEAAQVIPHEDYHVFVTQTNYQNNANLPLQEVYFDKKTLAPVAVNIMDEEKNVVIEVKFQEVEENPTFTAEDFNRDSILESQLADESVDGEVQPEDLAILYPLETFGAELTEKKESVLEDRERVILTFKGEKNFTLIQEQQTVQPTFVENQTVTGEVVNLGHSIGAVSEQALEWTYNGADFYLASEDMTVEELIEVASSVQGQGVK